MKNGIFALALCLCAGSLFAQPGQSGKQKDDEGNGDIYVHGRNPKEAGAPTAGGTGTLSPLVDHHGPVLSTPTAYLIWYGDWKQNNGSDTPEGQVLVRHFLANIGNSPYFNINSTSGGYGAISGAVNLSSMEAAPSKCS